MFDMSRDQNTIVSEFKSLLSSNSAWVERGILAVYERQTSSEKLVKETSDLNGIGFSGADAEILSSFAERIMSGKHLTEKQLNIAFRKMPKYAKQLYKISKKEI